MHTWLDGALVLAADIAYTEQRGVPRQQSPHHGGRKLNSGYDDARKRGPSQGKGGAFRETDHGYKSELSTVLEEWDSQPNLWKHAPHARSSKARCGGKLLVNPEVIPYCLSAES